jgi:hypothetical protein
MCKNIVSSIPLLSSTQIEELFKILHRNDCTYTPNNNGIFINLSWLKDALLHKIDHFIQFCHSSKQSLDSYTERIEEIREAMEAACGEAEIDVRALPTGPVEGNAPEGHDLALTTAAPLTSTAAVTVDARRNMTSTMRFYLLKKRFAKASPPPAAQKNDLVREELLLS